MEQIQQQPEYPQNETVYVNKKDVIDPTIDTLKVLNLDTKHSSTYIPPAACVLTQTLLIYEGIKTPVAAFPSSGLAFILLGINYIEYRLNENPINQLTVSNSENEVALEKNQIITIADQIRHKRQAAFFKSFIPPLFGITAEINAFALLNALHADTPIKLAVLIGLGLLTLKESTQRALSQEKKALIITKLEVLANNMQDIEKADKNGIMKRTKRNKQ